MGRLNSNEIRILEDTTGGDLATVSSCCHHFVVVKLVYHYYELCRDFPGSAKVAKKRKSPHSPSAKTFRASKGGQNLFRCKDSKKPPCGTPRFCFYTRRLNVRGFPGSAKVIKKPPNFGGLNGEGMRTGREPDSDAKIMIYRRYGTASTVTAKAVKKYLMSKKF